MDPVPANSEIEKMEYCEYLKYTGDRIRHLLDLRDKRGDMGNPDKLLETNEFWYDDLEAGNYDNCPASPVFAADSFGLETGRSDTITGSCTLST